MIQQLASLGHRQHQFSGIRRLKRHHPDVQRLCRPIIGATSSNAATATTNQTNAQTLLTGYQKQASTFSGVNLDTELANTVIYQNAYAASARVITVTSTLVRYIVAIVYRVIRSKLWQ